MPGIGTTIQNRIGHFKIIITTNFIYYNTGMIMGSQSVFILKTRHVISKFRHYPEFASKCCLQNDGGKPDQKPHLILFQAQVVAIMSRSDIAVFFEKYDEMAGAAESERRCHIRYRIGGISQQPFSMSQPPKICISADRHSVFGTKNPVEMSGGKIKLAGQHIHFEGAIHQIFYAHLNIMSDFPVCSGSFIGRAPGQRLKILKNIEQQRGNLIFQYEAAETFFSAAFRFDHANQVELSLGQSKSIMILFQNVIKVFQKHNSIRPGGSQREFHGTDTGIFALTVTPVKLPGGEKKHLTVFRVIGNFHAVDQIIHFPLNHPGHLVKRMFVLRNFHLSGMNCIVENRNSDLHLNPLWPERRHRIDNFTDRLIERLHAIEFICKEVISKVFNSAG
nr:hypothetical protein [uncultured Victivallis sp.]